MIDAYKEFKDVIRKFIEIKIIKGLENNELKLTRLELYSCIRYIENKNLYFIFTTNDKTPTKLSVNSKDIDWLINTALQNLVKIYTSYPCIQSC